jgi:hypothetical protein
MAKIFIICPVRNVELEVSEQLRVYVAGLEQAGHEVHWPSRDTDQSDDHGIGICITNCDAIIGADEVHIWWDPDSTGSKFDLGMLFALLRVGLVKKVVMIDPVSYTPLKSFENVLRALEKGYPLARRDISVWNVLDIS